MTELFELYKNDREAARKKIQSMDAALLAAELDDTLQFDVFRISNVDWAKMPNMQLYRAIVQELVDRCKEQG